MAGARNSLADYIAALDEERFVGRADDLAIVDRVLRGSSPVRVLFVHGIGGIGKSALLREVARRVAAAGRPIWQIDTRTLEPAPGELEDALAGALDVRGATVTIDSFERSPALGGLLRDRILPQLADDALIVIGSRSEPGPSWFRDGWEHVVYPLELGPLPRHDAAALLTARGVIDPAEAEPLLDWAGGSPLALCLGMPDVVAGDHARHDDDLPRLIVQRLAGDELSGVDAEVLELASVARAVDPALLAAVLPGRATRAAAEALRQSSIAELIGGRVTLHDLVRVSLRHDLRRRDRARYDRLRRAIADHLLVRAAHGEARLISDLIELVDDPEVRWGIGGNDHGRLRIDPWRPDDDDDAAPLVADLVEDRGGDGRWWDDLGRLLADAPEMGLVAIDVDGTAVGLCVATPVRGAPAVAEEDPILAPLLADARSEGFDDAIIYRDTHRMAGPGGDGARGVLNLAAVLRSGLANVRRSYILDTFPGADGDAFFDAVHARRRPDLDPIIAGERVACLVIDHGPAGMLGQVRDVVYAEATHAVGSVPSSATDAADRQAALDALRSLHRPDLLATNALVERLPGPTSHDRIELFRVALEQAMETAFGDDPSEQLLRDVLRLGDLDPDVTHERAMAKVAVSRATYFRQLRKARERVSAALVRDAGIR